MVEVWLETVPWARSSAEIRTLRQLLVLTIFSLFLSLKKSKGSKANVSKALLKQKRRFMAATTSVAALFNVKSNSRFFRFHQIPSSHFAILIYLDTIDLIKFELTIARCLFGSYLSNCYCNKSLVLAS
jgi:hypothetical protein